jgi:hypothetical protein
MSNRGVIWSVVAAGLGAALGLAVSGAGGDHGPPVGGGAGAGSAGGARPQGAGRADEVAATPPRQCRGRSVAIPDLRGKPGIQVDPRANDYDPLVLARAGVSPLAIWGAEPRDARWAGAMESKLRPRLQADLAVMVPGKLDGVQLECRTASCKVTAVLPQTLVRSFHRALSILNYGDGTGFANDSVETLPDGSVRSSVVIGFDDNRAPDAFDRTYPPRREKVFERWRERLRKSDADRAITPALPGGS